MSKSESKSVEPTGYTEKELDALQNAALEYAAEDWFSVAVIGGVARVHVFGEIGMGASYRELLKQVESAKDVKLFIDSPGGDSISGVELFKALRGRVSETTITGKCFSAAVPIALAGQKIHIERKARMLIHPVQTFYYGPALAMMNKALRLTDITDELRKIIIQRTEQEAVVVEGWLNADTYFSAEQALAYGLSDEIFDAPPAPTAVRIIPQAGQVAGLTPRALEFTEDELFLFDQLRANGKIKVSNLQAFLRELNAWAIYNTIETSK